MKKISEKYQMEDGKTFEILGNRFVSLKGIIDENELYPIEDLGQLIEDLQEILDNITTITNNLDGETNE